MSKESDVLGQADALMRRHRSFVARPAGTASAPAEIPVDAELPVLTEIIPEDQAKPQTLEEVLASLHEDIRDELSTWLVDILPAVVANASQHILNEIDAKTRVTLLPRLQEILAAHGKTTAENPPE